MCDTLTHEFGGPEELSPTSKTDCFGFLVGFVTVYLDPSDFTRFKRDTEIATLLGLAERGALDLGGGNCHEGAEDDGTHDQAGDGSLETVSPGDSGSPLYILRDEP